MAGDQEQHRRGDDLVVGQAIAVDLARGECSEEIVRGRRAPPGEVVPHIGSERLARRRGAALDFEIAAGLVHRDDVVRPRKKRGAIRLGDPHDVADRDQRQRGREAFEELDLAVGREPIHEPVRERLEPWPQPLGHALQERPIDERAKSRVLRRLQLEESVPLVGDERRQVPRWLGPAELLAARDMQHLPPEARIAEPRAHVVVAREAPVPVLAPMEHGRLREELAIRGIRILDERRVARVERQRARARVECECRRECGHDPPRWRDTKPAGPHLARGPWMRLPFPSCARATIAA